MQDSESRCKKERLTDKCFERDGMDDRLKKQIDFILEIDKEKSTRLRAFLFAFGILTVIRNGFYVFAVVFLCVCSFWL